VSDETYTLLLQLICSLDSLSPEERAEYDRLYAKYEHLMNRESV
jgi:hypothetical protein